MHFSALTPPEQRVLGCLIEKRFTTPDQYPLSINALRLAANQSTNRDPVLDLDEATINEAAQRLSRYGLVRLASGHSSRATKYRHLAEDALGLDAHQLSLLCVLLLRGPQTPGELKARTERMAAFSSLEQVDQVLDQLVDKGYVSRLARRPGQKEERWGQRLGGDVAAEDATSEPVTASAAPRAASVGVVPQNQPGGPPGPATSAGPGTPGPTSDLEARVAALEAAVAELLAGQRRAEQSEDHADRP